MHYLLIPFVVVFNITNEGWLFSVVVLQVMQIFFPYSIQLFPNEFPGEDPRDCPRNVKKEECVDNKIFLCLFWCNVIPIQHYCTAKLLQCGNPGDGYTYVKSILYLQKHALNVTGNQQLL
jgi:hypothetical protein